VSDEFTRPALAIEVGTHFVSERVVAALQRLARQRATPGALRMDNGPEFVAVSLRGFCHRAGINPAYIDPGKPWQNGYAESFPSRLRDEFNEERLHSSLGYQTRAEFAAAWEALKEERNPRLAAGPTSLPSVQPPADS
jgi:transposase InsO family protein